MKNSGCQAVYVGIESANDGVLRNMNKRATRAEFESEEALEEAQVLRMDRPLTLFNSTAMAKALGPTGLPPLLRPRTPAGDESSAPQQSRAIQGSRAEADSGEALLRQNTEPDLAVAVEERAPESRAKKRACTAKRHIL
jgi:hypothetical protein